MWEKDFQEWMNGSILGLAKAAWGLLKDSGPPPSFGPVAL